MDRPSSHGGKQTLRRYGREHFRELGRRGIRATAGRYLGGNVAECIVFLRQRGYEKQIAALAGQPGGTVEIAVICNPADDPYSQQSWAERVEKDEEREANVQIY